MVLICRARSSTFSGAVNDFFSSACNFFNRSGAVWMSFASSRAFVLVLVASSKYAIAWSTYFRLSLFT
jgi:hypothetical protein